MSNVRPHEEHLMTIQIARCLACEGIETNVRSAYQHEVLRQHGSLVVTSRSGYSPHAQSTVNITHYQCTSCGERWQYEDDKNDSFVGWSLDR
jgi:hypothetical protein